ncbi:MAG: ABC transporter permease [Firmicutes bacterium]|jgi:ABC-2 type transporter|nr:ABC transporter permease [Clostridia bacterium]MBS5022848.1 ABC transporter permease [Bacillota bacterium]
MKNIWTIMKKEFSRFFKDKRLVLALVLPGILIYLIYSFLGNGIFSKLGGTDENYVYQIYTANMPEAFQEPFSKTDKIELHAISSEEANAVKDKVADKDTDLLVVFPDDFEEAYEAVKNGTSETYPQVQLYYNTTRTEGSQAYALFSTLISEFQQEVNPYFLAVPQDLATAKDTTGMIFSMIAPMLVLMFLFSGCMAVAPESIAGEKERGTFATMLVTPVKRSHIAVGKIISLSVLSLISGLCSFLGLILSLPKLMGGMEGISASVYSAGSYLMLLGIILSSVLVIVSLISVVSALAKSVKEAANMIGPMMILVMLLGVSTMFSSGAVGSFFWYLIPLYNSARAMSGIFSFAASPVAVFITIGANVAAAVLLAFALAKMFDNEKIMFNK